MTWSIVGIAHPLERCITLKEHIMWLAKGEIIILNLDEVAETNHTIANIIHPRSNKELPNKTLRKDLT